MKTVVQLYFSQLKQSNSIKLCVAFGINNPFICTINKCYFLQQHSLKRRTLEKQQKLTIQSNWT